MVEKDFNYLGGFYIRHKEAKFCLTGTRWEIENLVENALAALEINCGRIILNNEAEKLCMDELKGIVLEGLDRHMLDWLEGQDIKNAFIKKQFFMELLWVILGDIRVNERAPFYEAEIGQGQKITMKNIGNYDKQSSAINLEMLNKLNHKHGL